MHRKLLSLGAGMVMVILASSVALADTGGGGGADLGLDAVQILGGTVDSKTGVAVVVGSISCSQDVDAFVYAELSQPVGRLTTLSGWGGTSEPVTCLAADGVATFTISVRAGSGKFAGGAATVSAGAEAGFCDELGCSLDDAWFGPASIRLTGGHR